MRIRAVAPFLAACFAIGLRAQNGYQTYSAGVNPGGITAADFNGDGKPDLAIANLGSNSLTILLNHSSGGGSGGFVPAAPVSFSASFAPRSIVAADLNRDGKTDLVVVGTNSGQTQTGSGGLVILLGNGDGTFQAPAAVTNSSGSVCVQVADFNGDGIPDLAATYLTLGFLVPTGAGLAIFPGNGDGTFGAQTGSFLGLTPWAVLTIGDFNGDRTTDIATAIGGALTVFLNDGKANFTPVINSGEPWNFAPAIAAGDLDGDGVLDLAVTSQATNPANGAVTILLGKGDGTFRAASALGTSATGQNAAIADLNGDGYADLVIGSSSPVFFPGRGDGTFESGLPFGASGNTGYFAIAGFTGSGAMGLAATNFSLTSGSLQTVGNAVILPQAVWPSPTLTNVSAAAFGLGPVAPGSTVAAFGSNLSTQTASASDVTPPDSLGGDTVTVTGADGKPLPAALYYVSSQQVNYVIPATAPQGLATVNIMAGGSLAAAGQIDIEPVAPALFTLNANNLAAAYITRVSQNGQQTFQPVYVIDANGNYLPSPIDLSSATDAIYLSVFGTGIRNAPTPVAASATVNAMADAQVTYAGPQGSYDGLDQVNILLPSGPNSPLVSPTPYSVELQFTIAGQPSNRVTLTVE